MAQKKSKKTSAKKSVKKIAKKAVKKVNKKASKKALTKKAVVKAKPKESTKKVAKKMVKKEASVVSKKTAVTSDIKKPMKTVKKIATSKAAEVAKASLVKKAKSSMGQASGVKLPPALPVDKTRLNSRELKLVEKWEKYYKKAAKYELAEYNMRHKYAENSAISHKKLGWGIILSNTNDRLEVLFQDGIKLLISNYN